MADQKLVELLKKGSEYWNEWRREEEYRSGSVLRANLCRGEFRGGDFRGADFRGADFRGADLDRTDLSGALLHSAQFTLVKLRGAKLSGAILAGTLFIRADLVGANLAGASLVETVFALSDLADAEGLDSCHHRGPTAIDMHTIRRSWPLPQNFLRGCGLSDHYIDYLPSLLRRPPQFYSCFISFSSKDDDFARKLHDDLQDRGVRCWFAPEHMKTGDSIRDRLEEVIRESDKLLLILSKSSIESAWVQNEVEKAFEEEKHPRRKQVLFPIRIDDDVMDTDKAWAATLRRTRHIGDFRRWKEHEAYTKGLERLLRDLKREARTEGAAEEKGR